MAVQNPFFGKRDTPAPGAFTSRNGTVLGGSNALAEPTYPGAATPSPSSLPPVPASLTTAQSAGTAARESSGSKLTVGPNIKLKGVEITDCDTLVVEGTVEATMDSRVIHIAEQGAFHGSAEIDIAEIHGEFTGSLTVREKLVIYNTGRVSGKIRYGKVIIEEGGQLSGEISVGVGQKLDQPAASAPVPARKPAAVAAADQPV